MKKKGLIWTIIIIAAIGTMVVPKILQSKNVQPSQQQPSGPDKSSGAKGPLGGNRAGGRPVTVSADTAKLTQIQELFIATGTIRAADDIEIRNEISGRVTGIFFKEGMLVKKGQLLVSLNDKDLQAQLMKANAALKLVKDREQRQRGLYEKQIISSEDYETSVKDLESAEADVMLLKAQIEKTSISAPFTGLIGLSPLSIGSYLTTGTKIANLVSVDNPEIECSIPERYAPYLVKGTKFTFTLSENSDKFNAEVIAIEPKIDEATRSVAFKARCIESNPRLINGSFVKVTMILNQHNGILVPGDAVISDIQGYKIFVNKNGKATPVLVKTGYRDEQNVEIVSGLNTGDIFVTSGAFLLRPNSTIDINGTNDSQKKKGPDSGYSTDKQSDPQDNHSGEPRK